MAKVWTMRAQDDRTVVTFDGEVDFSNAAALESDLIERVTDGSVLIIDLRGLRFLDSSGLRVLLRVWVRARDTDAQVLLVKGSPGVQRVLDLAGPQAPFEYIDDPAQIP